MNKINKNTIIHEIFEQWPQTAALFNQYGMSCPGCFMDQFERLEAALGIYQVPVEAFMREINEMVKEKNTSDKRQ